MKEKKRGAVTNISDAKAQLSRLVAEVERGRRVIIGRAGKPVAELVPFGAKNEPRKLGGKWQGKVKMAKDFDDLPPELLHAFLDAK